MSHTLITRRLVVKISLLGILSGSGTVSSFLQKLLDLTEKKKAIEPGKVKVLIIQEMLPIINQLYSYFASLKIIEHYQKENTEVPDTIKLAFRSQLESMALSIEHWKTTGLDLLILGANSETYTKFHTLLLFLKGNLMDKSWPPYNDPSGGKQLRKYVQDLLYDLLNLDLDKMAEYFLEFIKNPSLRISIDNIKTIAEGS